MRLAIFLFVYLIVSVSLFLLLEKLLKWIADKQRKNAIKNILYDRADYQVIIQDGKTKLIFDGHTFDL